jgi:hypothetical protein
MKQKDKASFKKLAYLVPAVALIRTLFRGENKMKQKDKASSDRLIYLIPGRSFSSDGFIQEENPK